MWSAQETVTRNLRFRETANPRIQNRVKRFPQKTRGPDGQIGMEGSHKWFEIFYEPG
jgi:hypothetical protein